MQPSAPATSPARPTNLCVKHGSDGRTAEHLVEAPPEVVRKIALLCVHECGLAAGSAQVAVRSSSDSSGFESGQIVEVAVLGGTLSDELGTGAAITSLIHRTLRSTGAIRSVRVTFF